MYEKTWKISKDHFEYIRKRDWITIEDKHLEYTLESNEGIVELIFQCTDSKSDWGTNLDYYPTKMQELFGEKTCIFGHEGFYNMYLGVRNQFLDECYELGENLKEIHIAGYSLGGGLTKLAFEDAVFHFAEKGVKVHGISYEGPRVFCPSREIKTLFKKYKKTCKLEYVSTFWDPVVHCPPSVIQMLPFIELYFYPFKIKFTTVRSGFSVWKDYGKKVRIGRWYKMFPMQHLPSEIRENLYKKFKE